MAVIKVTAKFRSNGREFDTQEEADRFDAICAAREELENAKRKFQRVLAEGCKTADGCLFEFGVFNDYYYVFRPWNAMPRLINLCYTCWEWTVHENGETVEIAEEPKDGERKRWVPIRELYRVENTANKVLLAERRKWLAEQEQEINDFAKKVK